jgi:hypothetical protein
VVIDGELVVPAVVVFGNGDKNELKAAVTRLSPNAGAAVCSVHKIVRGAARTHLHCKASNVALVQSLVGLMRAEGFQCAKYEDQAPGKAQQAAMGLAGAVITADVCKYFQAGLQCPHLTQKGKCRWKCWR